MTDDEDGIPRTVKPRAITPVQFLPIIAIHAGTALVERTGEIHSVHDAARELFLGEPPSLVIVADAAGFVADLELVFASHPDWQYKVTPMRQEIFTHSARDIRPPVIVDTIVNYFGFRNPVPKKPGKWFHPIDPYIFTRLGARKYLTNAPDRLRAYMEWGRDVRAFCQAQNLRLTTTGGGLAGQLLRDPRFYPQARRKVPKQTNAQAREHLPGNHYRLYTPELVPIPVATYLDMKSAHHNVAASLIFPHADRLQRRGDWESTDATDSTVPTGATTWGPGSDGYESLTRHSHGLLRVRLRSPEIPPTIFPPPYMESPGLRTAFIYTNEIPYILSLGGSIEGVDAAWTAFARDEGLNRYAAWALSELATMDDGRKQWAKPVLLSAYGVLAAKPREMEMGFRQAKGGEFRTLPAGMRTIDAYMKKLGTRETPTMNVIQRGMIEAQTRIEALTMAGDLARQGHRVLSIYADAVIIEPTGGAIPLLPAPWVIEGQLHNLRFLNATSFESNELRKLPGVPFDMAGRATARTARAKHRAAQLDSVRREK